MFLLSHTWSCACTHQEHVPVHAKGRLHIKDILHTKDSLCTKDILYTKDNLYTKDKLYTKDTEKADIATRELIFKILSNKMHKKVLNF